MNVPPPRSPAPSPAPQEDGARSGEGAETALKVLIRKRRQAQVPDVPPPEPQAPAEG